MKRIDRNATMGLREELPAGTKEVRNLVGS